MKSIYILALIACAAGPSAMASAGKQKSFQGEGNSCAEAQTMARRAARAWRGKHCKQGATVSYESAAAAEGDKVECDHEEGGKFTISRKVVCNGAKEIAAE